MNPNNIHQFRDKFHGIEKESASDKLKNNVRVYIKKPNKGIKIGSYRFGKGN